MEVSLKSEKEQIKAPEQHEEQDLESQNQVNPTTRLKLRRGHCLLGICGIRFNIHNARKEELLLD